MGGKLRRLRMVRIRVIGVLRYATRDLLQGDFDPFLYTQEPAEDYEAAGIVQTKTGYRANVYRVEAGQRADKPEVIAEFRQTDGH